MKQWKVKKGRSTKLIRQNDPSQFLIEGVDDETEELTKTIMER